MTSGPFAELLETWDSDGWMRQIIPLSPEEKQPLVSGHHGRIQEVVSKDLIEDWASRWPNANIGWVLPPGFVAVDVDCEPKQGAQTLSERETEWGVLPLTRRVTARVEEANAGSPHGCHIFLLPEHYRGPEIEWPGKVGLHVDFIWWGNRYLAAPPSRHPSGKEYGWLGGEVATLPEAWCAGLQKARAAYKRTAKTGVQQTIGRGPREQMIQRANLATLVLTYRERVRAGEGRNDMLHWVARKAAEAGHLDALGIDWLGKEALEAGLEQREIERVFQSVLERMG